MKSIAASEFKAKCLAILDEVAKTGDPVLILKRGKAVAELVPPLTRDAASPQAALIGSVRIVEDIIEPAVPADAWDAERHTLD